MKVSKKTTGLIILAVMLSTIFFACTKKDKLSSLVLGPAITNVASAVGSSTSATITWTTDIAATSKVYYGLSATTMTAATTETTSTTTNHSVNLTGLSAGTTYYYYVYSKDSAENNSTAGEDGIYSFTTTTAPLTISNVSATSSDTTSATVTWTTNTAASSKVYYGATTSFGSSTIETTATASNHSVNLTGLSANTKYYYYVYSKDSAGNTSTAGEDGSYFFTTNVASGPIISNVSATSSSTTSITVTWTTDVLATTQVFWGTTTSFGTQSTETDNTVTTMKTAHTYTITGLTAGTKYYYYVKSKNAAYIASTSGDDGSLSFTTTNPPPGGTMYLMIDDINITGTTGTTFEIYGDAFNSSAFTGGSNNLAYMGSAADGSAPHITGDSDAAYTGDQYTGTSCWRIPMTIATSGWDGIYVLASGAWRTNFTGIETGADLSGPTGTVTISCWAKVAGVTSTKIKIGIGDDSAYTDAANIESFGTVGIKSTCKKESATGITLNSSTWTKLTVTIGTDPNLSNINGDFFWSMSMADVVQ